MERMGRGLSARGNVELKHRRYTNKPAGTGFVVQAVRGDISDTKVER
jgi:hypothetical protein